MKIIRYLILVLFIICAGLSCYGFYIKKIYDIAPTPIIKDVIIDENNYINVLIDLKDKRLRNDIYYLYKDNKELPPIDASWNKVIDNKIAYEIFKNSNYYLFLKNEDNKIIMVDEVNNIGKITKISLNKEKIYMALNSEDKIDASIDYIGIINPNIIYYSNDASIASIDSKGKITSHKKGTTKIGIKVENKDINIDVIVTDLIVKKPKNFNRNKKYLPCGRYTKEENDILDDILKNRIENVGYKTRAGVVEAARFLTLEFPYKIRYFSENGRGNTNGVDGEGRYYHVGLYLNTSRFSSIKKKANGPKTWGCPLYSRPSHGKRSNGLDCSGFVSWVLLNGGFDVGDIGAGLAPHLDLTDYGKRIKFNENVVKSGKVKVGDLLSSGGINGGHIAIIVGEDDKNYYVAESLWTPPNVAVSLIAYSKKTIYNRYYYVMLMDNYYKEDGKLTKLWY